MGGFLDVLVCVCSFVSLGACPDFLLSTLSLLGSTHNANHGSYEGRHIVLLPGFTQFIFIFNLGDYREPGSCIIFRRFNFKEEVKSLTVEWKVMRVPFPFSLSLR